MQKDRSLGLLLKILILLLVIASIGYLVYGYFMVLAYPIKYKGYIKKYSKANNVDPYMLTAIIREESRFNPKAQSGKGAVGLMQLMPKTANWISKTADYHLKDGDLNKPQHNIKYGSWYFSYLKKKYKSDALALSAYNAGSTNVDRWIKRLGHRNAKKKIPFPETKQYVSKVKEAAEVYEKLYPEAF